MGLASFFGRTLTLAAVAVACSSSTETPSNGGTSACAASGTTICQKACACGTDGKCTTGHHFAAGTTTLEWKSLEDCKAAYAGSACKNADSSAVNWNTCTNDVTASDCTNGVFLVPQTCEVPQDGG